MTTKDLHSNLNPLQKNRLILSNLSDKQKDGLKDGSIGLVALLSGASMYKLFGANAPGAKIEECIDEGIPESMTTAPAVAVIEESVIVETELPFATQSNEGLSFADSFANARTELGAGGFFEWQGQTYNTYYKEEWEAMTEADQHDFAAQVREQSQLDQYEIVSPQDIAIDTNQDGVDDVILSDIDGDGQLDIKEIDLNGDGHIDVIHATQPTASAAAEEAEPVIEGEPIYGVHIDETTGVLDAIAIDHNHDGYADTVIVDIDQDGHEDFGAFNIGDDDDLDIVVIDADQNGLDIDDQQQIIEYEVNMDDFIILDEEEVEALNEETQDVVDDEFESDEFFIEGDDVSGIEI